MKKRGDDFKLGLSVIVMFALLVGGLLFIGGGKWRMPERRDLIVRFAPGGSMPELVPGSVVTCLGQRVGEIEQGRIIEADDPNTPERETRQFLEIVARVRADLGLRIDCRVMAVAPPLGGKGSMGIVSRGRSEKPLPENTPVYGESSGLAAVLDLLNKELDDENRRSLLAHIKGQLDETRPESLIAKIHQSLDDVNQLTERWAGEMDAQHASSLLGKVHASLDDVNRLTVQLARQVDATRDQALIAKVHAMIQDVRTGLSAVNEMIRANRPHVDQTILSVEHAAQTVDTDILQPLAGELDPSRPGSIIAQAHTSFDRLNRSLENIQEASQGARNVVALNSGRIGEVVENASEASLTLKNGIRDLSLRPWRLLQKPSRSRQRQLQTITVAREFAESAASLDDAASRLASLREAWGDEIPADDPQLAAIFSDLRQAIDRFSKMEQALWESLRKK